MSVNQKQQRVVVPQLIIGSSFALLLTYLSLAIADHVGTPQFVRYVFSPGYVLGLRFSDSFGNFVLIAVGVNITYFGLLIFLLVWKINWPKLRKNPRHRFWMEP
jgi:hypothetical protein